MPQMTQVTRERAIVILNAGASVWAVAAHFNANHSTISHLRTRFRETGSTVNRPHARRPRVTTPAQDPLLRLQHNRENLQPATWTASETVGMHNRRISAQTVRNRSREVDLRDRCAVCAPTSCHVSARQCSAPCCQALYGLPGKNQYSFFNLSAHFPPFSSIFP